MQYDAFCPEKYRGDILEDDEQGLQGRNRQNVGGVYGRYDCQVRRRITTHQASLLCIPKSMTIQHDVCLEKCTFRVTIVNVLDFYLTLRGIEANTYKYEVIIQMVTPTIKKKVMRMNGRLTTLKSFILKSSQHALPFYKLLTKEAHFE